MKEITTPHRWLILKIGDIYKVFGSWFGGYLDGDAWRLNSGIERVEDAGDHWLFHGFSGSVYQCRKDSCGSNAYGYAILNGWLLEFEDMEIMGNDFDPATLNIEEADASERR